MQPTDALPVVIVGAGPAGLTAALLLARQGVAVQVFERHNGVSIHPRARGLNVRTMEIYRGLGLDGAIQQAGAPLAASKYMLFVETLAGREIRRVLDDELTITADALAAYTPCAWTQCAQDALEPLLLDRARAAGAVVHFGTEARVVAHDDEVVTLELRSSTGTPATPATRVRARYVLAADGANGHLRDEVGIPLIARAVQGSYVNIYFRADLRSLVAGREFALCFVEQPTAPGIFLAVNNADLWLFNAEYDPATTTVDSFTPEHCLQLVRDAVGIRDLPVEFLSALPWDATARYAASMRQGRVFLLGDAAHTMPPAGGLGLNSGVADAHNLAWKLAYVLQGTASPTLLDTYDAERLPVARDAVEHAVRELEAERPDAVPEDDMVETVRPALGMTYASTAVIADDKSAQDPASEAAPRPLAMRELLSGRPGTRLPHVWLEREGRRLSTLDLVSDRFTLMTGPSGAVWLQALNQAPERAVVTVAAIGAPNTLRDAAGDWLRASGIEATGALLVRPDGIVAWRARTAVADAAVQLSHVLRQALGVDSPRPNGDRA